MDDTAKFINLDWQVWFYWIMATTAGWLIGNLFFFALPVIIAGAIIAASQWAVLYKRMDKAWQWIPLSFTGWLAGNLISVLFLPSPLAGPVMGFITGIAQWLFLRRWVNLSGWWIIFSTIGWTTGLTLMPGILTSGALPGAITGLTLVILLEFAPKIATNQET